MKHLTPALCASALLALPCAAASPDDADNQGRMFQAFLGVLELDDQTGEWQDISDDNVDVDFSSLPSGGLEAEYIYYRGWVHVGLNPGGSVAWKSEDTNFSGGYTSETGGRLRVELDNSLFIAELHLGGFVRGRLSQRITTYAAAGPMIIYGSHEVEDEDVEGEASKDEVDLSETDSSDINIGYYARAGLDFELGENQFVGLGVRYMSSELDFDDTIGEIDIEGPQYVLTFSTRF